MSLTILNVAYPLAKVGPNAVGGAEQVVSMLDRAVVRAGHRSLVVACAGSNCAGTLLPVPPVRGTLHHHLQPVAQAHCTEAIRIALACWHVDVVHLHGLDFHAYLPPPGPPALVTLHLPPAWYEPGALRVIRPDTHLHCVSAAQHAACPPGLVLLPDIENGVDVEALTAPHRKRGYVMALGRICREKGFHLALDAATEAGVPLVLGGEVFPYEQHQAYFRDEIAPRLDRSRRFLGPLGFARKRRLLTAARALLVPSLVPETGSLVAMEALACGTPVVAFRAGALSTVVEPGVTGYLVEDAHEMAEAIHAVTRLDPEACREAARARFSTDRMLQRYLGLYQKLAQRVPWRATRCASTVPAFRGTVPGRCGEPDPEESYAA